MSKYVVYYSLNRLLSRLSSSKNNANTNKKLIKK